MRYSAAFVLCALALPAFSADESELVNLLPSSSQMVMGAHVRAVLDSSLAHLIMTDLKVGRGDLSQVFQVGGFDPLQDIDEVLMATSGEGQMPPTLIVATGHFGSIKMPVPGADYHGVKIYAEAQHKEGAVAFLDDSTALAGDEAEIRAALDRRGMTNPLDPALSTEIQESRRRYSLWGIVLKPSNLTQRLPDSAQSKVWDAIDRFQFGVVVAKGLDIAGQVHVRSEKDATELSATLRLFEAMARASQPAGQNTPKLGIEDDGKGNLKLSVSISEAQIQEAMKSKLGSQAVTPANRPTGPAAVPTVVQASAAPAAAAAQSAPAPPAVIRPASDGEPMVFTLPGRKH